MKQLLCLIAFIAFIQLKGNAQDSYVVNVDKINVRKSPSKNGEILGSIQRGEVVSVIDFSNSEWFKISYYGQVGFVSSKFLVPIENSEEYKGWKKTNIVTGANPECENISPRYDTSLTTKLIIAVGRNADVMVKLMTKDDVCIRLVYIKAGETYTMRYIPEDYYYLRVAYGKDMRKKIENGQCVVKFLVDPTYKKGSETLDYYRKRKPDTVDGDYVYKNWEVPSYRLSLNIEYSFSAFKGNNFNSVKISEKEFNQ